MEACSSCLLPRLGQGYGIGRLAVTAMPCTSRRAVHYGQTPSASDPRCRRVVRIPGLLGVHGRKPGSAGGFAADPLELSAPHLPLEA